MASPPMTRLAQTDTHLEQSITAKQKKAVKSPVKQKPRNTPHTRRLLKICQKDAQKVRNCI